MSDRPILTPDFETGSEADLQKVGAWCYSEHPSTHVIILGWGYKHNPRQKWWPYPHPRCAEYPRPVCDMIKWDGIHSMPRELYQAIRDGAEFEAHNCGFEYSMWANVMVARHGWCPIPDEAWRDTMATACYYALPAKLDNLAKVLGLPGKPPEAARLISKYSKLHLKTAKWEIPVHDMDHWGDYVDDDVAQEQKVSDLLGDLPDRELPVFQLNQKINRRGLFLDMAGIEAATALSEQKAALLSEEFRDITGGIGPAQHAKALGWFKANGLPDLENLQKETIKDLLAPENNMKSGPARRALELRLAINKASVKKLNAMAAQCDPDGRARFQTRYHGAGTGRETASGFQVLNMSRGFEYKAPSDKEPNPFGPDDLVGDILHGDLDYLDMVYGNAMDAIGKATRHWIMAQPGNVIRSGDFSSIEAVGLACLAGEDWKVEAFREKQPIYCVAACKVFGMDPQIAVDLGDKKFKEKYGDKRQTGKICELAFGYQGALGAWLGFDSSGTHSDEDIVGFCKGWRREHPETVAFWRGLETAAIEAVARPGKESGYSSIGFDVVDDGDGLRWLSMILPDGKRLWYWDPQLRMVMPKWHNPEADPDCADGTCDCKLKPQLTYMAWKFGKWRRVATYGGKLTENAVQATCRQLLMPAAMALDEAGYSLILTVYDEIVSEDPIGFGSVKEFEEIMLQRPRFARDWPIAADVWEGQRYRK
jgi:DNA polymerase